MASGFPPEAFTDLKLPVVDPGGDLDENALKTVHGGTHSVEAIDEIDDETVGEVKELLEELPQRAFDEGIGGDE